jgi:TatD DNase family protein
MLIDTHAHIHFEEFSGDLEGVFSACRKNKVESIITVGTDEADSRRALEFVWNEQVLEQSSGIGLYATAGLHPHEARKGEDALLTIKELVKDGGYGKKLVAIGECGLDYYRNNSEKKDQYRALEFQLELAIDQALPLIFHVRDAWEDFFGVIKNYPSLRGVIHSFTGSPKEVELASEYNLYFGLNGIMTFSKEQNQLEAAKLIPAERLLLETDCPFLAPEPVRGKRNEPANVKYVANFLAQLRGESFQTLNEQTTINAKTFFEVE